MVSNTCKDGILSPECLTYWSRWLEVTRKTWVLYLAVRSSGREVSLGRNCKILQICDFLKIWNFSPILKFANLTASSSRYGVLAKATYWMSHHSDNWKRNCRPSGKQLWSLTAFQIVHHEVGNWINQQIGQTSKIICAGAEHIVSYFVFSKNSNILNRKKFKAIFFLLIQNSLI